MDSGDYQDFLTRISKINELRVRFWSEFRDCRNKFLKSYPPSGSQNDHQWKEIKNLLDDMWKSTVTEEIRRQLFHAPGSLIEGVTPKTGLYKSNKLCIVCGLPLQGRQKSYCSESCRNIRKSRQWRKNHPDKKREIELKYLKECKRLSRKRLP